MAQNRKAVIKNADMPEDMQSDAIDVANQAQERHNIEKDIAAFIKKEFDKKYSPTWHCIVVSFTPKLNLVGKILRVLRHSWNEAFYILLHRTAGHSLVQEWLNEEPLSQRNWRVGFVSITFLCIPFSIFNQPKKFYFATNHSHNINNCLPLIGYLGSANRTGLGVMLELLEKVFELGIKIFFLGSRVLGFKFVQLLGGRFWLA